MSEQDLDRIIAMNNVETASEDADTAEEYKLPEEWQAALNALYARYSDNPTPAQRIRILESALGLDECSYLIESTSDWRTPPEEIELRNMRVLELDYLEQIGLHKPHYC